jgi:hypothetical protein
MRRNETASPTTGHDQLPLGRVLVSSWKRNLLLILAGTIMRNTTAPATHVHAETISMAIRKTPGIE